jgi:uncharacterized protein
MPAEPLTDQDFESLSNVLEHLADKRAMNIEQLDGFLAAIICCPSDISPTEYLPEIWGDAMINEYSFTTQPLLQEFLSLVERHRSAIIQTLQSGDAFTPVLLPDENNVYRGNDWASGFLRGMTLRNEEWSALLDDEDNGGSLVPILVLAHEHDPDPDMRPYKEPMSEERREQLLVGAAAGVMRIYKHFRRQHPVADIPLDPASSTYRRFVPKTGRNEPCPCGSGKKFKNCCGKVTLH